MYFYFNSIETKSQFVRFEAVYFSFFTCGLLPWLRWLPMQTDLIARFRFPTGDTFFAFVDPRPVMTGFDLFIVIGN